MTSRYMSKYRLGIMIVIAALGTWFFFYATASKNPGTTAGLLTVSATVDADIKTVNQLISHYFELRTPTPAYRSSLPPPFDKFVSSNVTGHEEIKLESAASRASDPLLKAYATLPASSREYDVFLFDPIKREWASEYYHPLPLYTSFIVHLSSEDGSKTRIDILEFEPYVRATSLSLGVTHTGIPWFVSDIKWVAPTNKERADLLGIIVGLVRSKEH